MTYVPTGVRRRATAVALASSLAFALGVAGCGDDDSTTEEGASTPEPAAVEITATDEGLTAPESAAAGLAEITLTNDGEQPHSAQLLRVEGDRDAEEVEAALGKAESGKAFDEWFFAGGGVGTTLPGESATVTQELEAGSTYWIADDEGRGSELVPLEITGEASDAAIPEGDNVVSAVDFSFETDGLAAGEPVTFENNGEQPHHMVAAPIIGDASLEDVETFFKTEKGKPPVDFEGSASTSVLEGSTSQLSGVELESGRYALVCFISNREGGPPHVALGMIDEVEVE